VILSASSMLPMIALIAALPHSSRIRGLSYIVLRNLIMTGSGVATENSLYPCVANRLGISERNKPLVADVLKYAIVS
jgi:hypothetical protein